MTPNRYFLGKGIGLAVFVFIAFTVWLTINKENIHAGEVVTGVAMIDVYKSPSCQCCGKWIAHIETAGFSASVINSQNLNAIKSEYGIAPRYQSCHTAVADGFVFEGHIPASLIQQFLAEKPEDVIGLAVPGMPMGSPGMEMGERYDDYDVLLLKADGSSEVYQHISAGKRQH